MIRVPACARVSRVSVSRLPLVSFYREPGNKQESPKQESLKRSARRSLRAAILFEQQQQQQHFHFEASVVLPCQVTNVSSRMAALI